MDKLILAFASKGTVKEQIPLVSSQSIELQCYLFERFAYAEKLFEQHGGEEYLFPTDFGQFLEEILIIHWDYRLRHGLFD